MPRPEDDLQRVPPEKRSFFDRFDSLCALTKPTEESFSTESGAIEKTPLPAFPDAKTIARICLGSQRCPIRAVSYISYRDCGIAGPQAQRLTRLDGASKLPCKTD
jgi:hypothetical protein